MILTVIIMNKNMYISWEEDAKQIHSCQSCNKWLGNLFSQYFCHCIINSIWLYTHWTTVLFLLQAYPCVYALKLLDYLYRVALIKPLTRNKRNNEVFIITDGKTLALLKYISYLSSCDPWILLDIIKLMDLLK